MTDQPWGVTLAELGKRQFTGLLTLVSDSKEYSISFDLGRVVGATSPLASDAAVRIALTNHLVSSSQAVDFNRRIAAAGDRDEMEVLAELAQIPPEVADKLRRRLVAQRAARTFSLEQGTYAADDRVTIPPGCDLDVREVIYLGARMNLTEQRLTGAVRSFGASFRIKPDAMPLEAFGFGDEEQPVIQSLLRGASIPEIEAAHRDLDPRMVQAIVYALLSSGACHMKRAATASIEYGDGPVTTPRTMTPTEGTYSVSRTPTADRLTDTPAPRHRPARDTGSSLRSPAAPPVEDSVPRIPVGRRGRSTDSPLVTTRAPAPEPVVSRTPTGEPILSLPPSSDPTGFRSASDDPAPSRTATPVSKGLGLPTIPKPPRRSDPLGPVPAVARTATGRPATSRTQTSDPPGGVEVTSRTRTADDIPATPAGDAYRRGESALRRDEPSEAVRELARACALEPNNVDFHAMLGWAQFCAARDKVTISPETRTALERAIQRSATPTNARFLLGRVERMLGRDREALGIFEQVVESSPGHAEARAEIRAIEARLERSSTKR